MRKQFMLSGSQLIAVAIFSFGCIALSVTYALAQSNKFQWTARVTLAEQYDDNVNLTANNTDYDWITTLGPGLTLAILTETNNITLDYDLNYKKYAREKRGDLFEHRFKLTGLNNAPISDRTTLDLDAFFYTTDDPVELDKQITSTRTGRSRYSRYLANGRINYQFSQQGSAYLGFRYNQLENKDPSVQDSRGYGGTTGISYWFNIHNGLSFDFVYGRGEFEVSDDFDAFRGNATYTYRFNPETQTTLGYSYDSLDFKGAQPDQVVHQATWGMSHQFSPEVSGGFSVGGFVRHVDHRKNTNGTSGTLNLSANSQKASFNINGAGGYRYQYFQAENLGFTLYSQATATFTYQLQEGLSTRLSAFYNYDDYKDAVPRRKDHTWGARAGLNYLIFQSLSASLSYDYRQRESNIGSRDYIDNRVTLSLTAFYLSQPKPF